MRSRVSRKKRKIIIISSVVITILAVFVLVWKLSSYTKSLKMDFDSVGLNCSSVAVLSDGNFAGALSDGTVPDTLVTDEVKSALQNAGAELCVVWLEYSIRSQIELDENKFAVDIKPTTTAKGKFYSYTPVSDIKKDGNTYSFRQAMLVDRVDVKDYFFKKELPRPFKGSCSFELQYTVKETGKTNKVGFHADNQL